MNWCGREAHRVLPGLALLTAAALLLIAVGAPVAGAAAPGAAASAPMSAQQVREFWTLARMRRAKPIEVHGPGRVGPVASAAERAGAETPHRVPPLAPRAGASVSSASEQVSDPTVEGLRQNGVIFFVVEGFLARCSGTSVNSPNRSVVFTAGHCIDSGGPHDRSYGELWVFVPGYRYGQRPFGVFPAKWIDATRRWIATGGENFDVGAAVVKRNERGQRLGDAVGGAGIAWGLSPAQVFDVHGYPVAPPFDGETQHLCAQTPFLGHDPRSFVEPGPLNLAVDCEVTGGASGGGWTIAGGLLNSVTNYGYFDDPATDFGAYFGKEVARLYGRAARVR
jgi:hypothetical protein